MLKPPNVPDGRQSPNPLSRTSDQSEAAHVQPLAVRDDFLKTSCGAAGNGAFAQ